MANGVWSNWKRIKSSLLLLLEHTEEARCRRVRLPGAEIRQAHERFSLPRHLSIELAKLNVVDSGGPANSRTTLIERFEQWWAVAVDLCCRL